MVSWVCWAAPSAFVRAATIPDMLRPEPIPVDVIRAFAADAPVLAELVLGVVEETAELIALNSPCKLGLVSACQLKT